MGCLKLQQIESDQQPLRCVWKSTEYQKTDVNWYDYGARFYDPALGRFHTMDPLSEIYSYQSPFAYAANNPISNIDFQGMSPLGVGGDVTYTINGIQVPSEIFNIVSERVSDEQKKAIEAANNKGNAIRDIYSKIGDQIVSSNEVKGNGRPSWERKAIAKVLRAVIHVDKNSPNTIYFLIPSENEQETYVLQISKKAFEEIVKTYATNALKSGAKSTVAFGEALMSSAMSKQILVNTGIGGKELRKKIARSYKLGSATKKVGKGMTIAGKLMTVAIGRLATAYDCFKQSGPVHEVTPEMVSQSTYNAYKKMFE